MKLLQFAGIAVTALILSACGGGGSGSGSATTTTTSSTTTTTVGTSIPKYSPTAGDSGTYAYSISVTGGATTNMSLTRAYPSFGAGGGHRIDTWSDLTLDPTTHKVDNTIDSDFAISQYVTNGSGGITITCTYSSPLLGVGSLPAPVGQTWNQTITKDCVDTGAGTYPQVSITNSGSVAAIETVVTSAGTFTAGKVQGTLVETVSGSYTRTTNRTCWADMATGRTVKCDASITYVPVGGSTQTYTYTFSLTSYIANGVASSSTPERFAGTWGASFTGDASGTCLASATTSGTVTGNCTFTGGSAFTISGTVSANGAVSFSASTGAVFSGTLSSTTDGNGTWTYGGGSQTGTWVAVHR